MKVDALALFILGASLEHRSFTLSFFGFHDVKYIIVSERITIMSTQPSTVPKKVRPKKEGESVAKTTSTTKTTKKTDKAAPLEPQPVVVQSTVNDVVQIELSAAAMFAAAHPLCLAFRYTSASDIKKYNKMTSMNDKIEYALVLSY